MMQLQHTIMTSISVKRVASFVVMAALLSALCCPPSVSAAKRNRGGPNQKNRRGRRWQEGDIRLIGGRRRYEGVVMLNHNGKWGAVCDDMWDDADADVVCRQNGFPGFARKPLKTEFGARAKRRIWITQVRCNGTEARLLDCAFKGWGVHIRRLCPGKWRAVGVVCKPKAKPMRMAAAKRRKAATLKNRNRTNWLARRAKTREAAAKRKAAMELKRRKAALRKRIAMRRKALKLKAEAAAAAKKTTTTEKTVLANQLRATEANMEVKNKVPVRPWAMYDSIARGTSARKPSSTSPVTTPSSSAAPTTTTKTPGATTTTAATTTTTTPSTTTTQTTTTTTTPTTTTTTTPTTTTTTTPPTTTTTTTTTITTPTTTTTSTTVTTTTTTPSTTTSTEPTTTTTEPTTTTSSPAPETRTTTTSPSTSAAPTTTARDTIEKSTLTTAAGATDSSNEKTTVAAKDPEADSQKEKTVDLSKVKTSGELTVKDKESERELLLQADSPGNPDVEIRLVGGRYNTEGLLEVRESSDQPWGTICGVEWGMRETIVTCKQLGLNYAKQPLQTNYFGGHDRPKTFYAINCTGRESKLSECTFTKTSEEYTCPKRTLVAGVVCTSSNLPDLIPNLLALSDSVRLQDRPLYYLQCALEENCLANSAYEVRNNSRSWRNAMRRLLRFSTIVHNRGTDDFRPYVNKGQWQWHTCHMHFHSMEVFAHYDIMDQAGNRLAEGSKASFCLEDTVCERGAERQFLCAGFGDQGLSVNCSDNYLWDIDCQWIDITDIKPGHYTFLLEVNPEMLVSELDFDNNVARCDLYYSGYFAKFSNCRHQSLLDYRR